MLRLAEYGFFDYLSPHFGGLETFGRDDYLALLDDMAGAGMNSLNIGIRGQTTGWRSRLAYLDQEPSCANIASDNALVREVIEQARARGIGVWFTVCVNRFVLGPFGLSPVRTWEVQEGVRLPFTVAQYDSDAPGIVDRAVEICREVVELFPGLDGLVLEAENMDLEAPHRIPLYNQWAKANGRKPFDQLGHPLWAKTFDVPEWRDYTTYSKCRLFSAVRQAVGQQGFAGRFATFCEIGSRANRYCLCQAVNIAELLRLCPGCIAVTYQYEKWLHRYTLAEYCMQRPRDDGATTYYLPRGVMTWGWPLPIPLQEHWRMDVEDIEKFRPDGVWWFGMGSLGKGIHIRLDYLRQSGYRDSREAWRDLMRVASPLRARGR